MGLYQYGIEECAQRSRVQSCTLGGLLQRTQTLHCSREFGLQCFVFPMDTWMKDTNTHYLIFKMPCLPQRLGTPKFSSATPGQIGEVTNGYPLKFSHGWLTLSPAAPMSICPSILQLSPIISRHFMAILSPPHCIIARATIRVPPYLPLHSYWLLTSLLIDQKINWG